MCVVSPILLVNSAFTRNKKSTMFVKCNVQHVNVIQTEAEVKISTASMYFARLILKTDDCDHETETSCYDAGAFEKKLLRYMCL